MKLCYCDSVKNLTVSIPDDVYRAARVRAAEGGSSVSALVADYLRSLGDDKAEFSRILRDNPQFAQRVTEIAQKRYKVTVPVESLTT